MSHIRSRDTKPELAVRRWLWRHGYRYRLNVKSVPGKPDIVMRPYRTALFVNGCFWHGHGINVSQMENTACCKIPSSNRAFWEEKIRRNKERDERNYTTLRESGWQVIVVWECQLKARRMEHTMRQVEALLNENRLKMYRRQKPKPYTTGEENTLPLAAEEREAN